MGKKHLLTKRIIHGHRTLKAPHPVRSVQLTKVLPSHFVHISPALNNIIG
jgi:hypothetical protein